jgi:hypothetical protein
VSILAGCFVLLQAGDFLLTWLLLDSGRRPEVYEANPLALAVLSRLGWAGLGGFKCLCSLVTLIAVLALCRRHARAGARLLAGLCTAMLAVVGYSGALLAQQADPESAKIDALLRQGSLLEGRIAALHDFDATRAAICKDLLAGKDDFPAAVGRMARCLARFSPALTPLRRRSLPDPGRPDEVAAYVYYHAYRIGSYGRLRPRLADLAAEMACLYPAAPRLEGPFPDRGNRRPWSAPSGPGQEALPRRQSG